jgi:hypothetical protein
MPAECGASLEVEAKADASLEQYSSWDLTARTVTFDVPASDV